MQYRFVSMLYIVVLICFSFQDFKVEQVVPFMSEEPTSKFFMFWTGFIIKMEKKAKESLMNLVFLRLIILKQVKRVRNV